MTNLLFTPANLYKDIHKGLRGELFAVTGLLGSLDTSDECALAAASDRVARLSTVLESHAAHEDHWVLPHIEAHLPELAERIAADHAGFEPWFADIAKGMANADGRLDVHEAYLELSSFTASYLEHLDVEERQVLLPLVDAMGPDAAIGVHLSIIGSLTPEETAMSLPLMFTAMNVDDRTALLGGMRATAPAEVFTGVWALFTSVLGPDDVTAVAQRLDIA